MTIHQIDPRMVGFQFTPTATSISQVAADDFSPNDYPFVRLRTNLRDHEFEWKTGNYTTRVAADLYNGRYIKKTSVSAADGAWVAVPKRRSGGAYISAIDGRFAADEWFTPEFSVPDEGADASPYLNAMYNLANIDRPGLLQYDYGLFTLSSRLPTLTYQSRTKGFRNGSFQPTIIQKNYVELNTKLGIFSYNKWAFELDDIAITSTGIASGGSAISIILLDDDIGPGDAYMRRPYVSSTGFNHALHVNGLLAVSSPAVGYRHLVIESGIFLNALDYTWDLHGMRHLFASATVVANNTGVGFKALNVDGSATVHSDDIMFHGGIFGNIDLDYCERSTFVTPISSNVTNTANTKSTVFVGAHNNGTVQSNWVDQSGVLSPP